MTTGNDGDDGAGGDGGGGFDAALLTGEGSAGAAGDAGGSGGVEDKADKGEAGDKSSEGGDPWFASLPDDAADDKTLSDRKWAENKKYPDVPSLVKAMRGLESQLGGEKVPLPKGAEDKDGWERLWKAAGRPDAPDGYSFAKIEGLDPALTGAFAPVAHQLGLSQAQAEGVAQWNEAMVAEDAKARMTAHAGEVTTMRKEAGTEFDAMLERGLRAAERFGLAQDDLTQLRNTIGPRKLIGMLDSIGKAMGEDGMAGSGRQDMGMTANKAETRKAEIMRDKEFQARLNAKEPTALAEWSAINTALIAAEEKKRAA